MSVVSSCPDIQDLRAIEVLAMMVFHFMTIGRHRGHELAQTFSKREKIKIFIY